MRVHRRLIAAVAVAMAALIGLSACNFGSQGQVGANGTTNGVFLTARSFTVRLVAMPTAYHDAAAWALTHQFAPTDLIVTYGTAACTDSVRSCVFALNYGNNGLYGWNACRMNWAGQHPDMYCGQARTRINTYYAPPPRPLACHEIGHSVGLRHTDDTTSCMNNVGTFRSTLNQHDRDHLNGHY